MSRYYSAIIDGHEIECFEDWNGKHWISRESLAVVEVDQDCDTELEGTADATADAIH